MRTLRASSFLLLLITTACIETDPDDLAPAADVERCLGCTWGPPVLNTHLLNGLPVDALDLSGGFYRDMQLVSVSVPQDGGLGPVVDLRAEEGVLFGTTQSGDKVSADAFVGSVWEIEDHRFGGPPVATTMTITDFKQEPTHARYTFTHVSPLTWEKEMSTCDIDPYTGEASVILFQDLEVETDGTMHDAEHLLYFGCVSGAVGKAVLWGYTPWEHGFDAHQTATRVVRADYCGDGISWTEQGTGLQLEDVQQVWSFADPAQSTEAIWGPDGALCLKEPRLDYNVECANGFSLPNCYDQTLADHPTALIHSKLWQHVQPEL